MFKQSHKCALEVVELQLTIIGSLLVYLYHEWNANSPFMNDQII